MNNSDNGLLTYKLKISNPGTYTMEVSARSDYHALDRFVLFSSDVSQNIATDNATELSFFDCSEIYGV